MDDPMPKLPRYVFRRANGTYRYKRDVPKDLRKYIRKKTLYRQLGVSYEEALAALPRVHREIEAIFQVERLTSPGERASALIQANLGDVWVEAAERGKVGQDPKMLPIDPYADLADELEDANVPAEVVDRVRFANVSKPEMTLERVFHLYLRDKAQSGTEATKQHSLEQRITRLRQDVTACLGATFWQYRELPEIRRRDVNTLRDHLLTRLAPNSVIRTLNIAKAAVNHVIREEELDCRNPFAAIKVEGSGASKTDRLPLSEEDMQVLLPAYESNTEALTLFVTLADTGARLAEIVGLEVGDLAEDSQSIHIRPNSHRGLKTRNSARHIPLSPRAFTLLRDRLSPDHTDTDPLFPNYAGPRGNDKASAMLMKRLRRHVIDPKKTIHSLRHRMKDRLRNTDCPEALSLAILGHSQNTIADNYGAGYALEKMRQALQSAW
jgi:integrase